MAYSYEKHAHGTITNWWPDDTDTEFYIADSATFKEIIERCREKWGKGWKLEDISIRSEFHHTACLGYDLMDWGDYTRFLCITKKGA